MSVGKSEVYFRCHDCGGKIRPFDGRTYYAPLERDPEPLRAILARREKEAGRRLCDACWERFLERRSDAIH